MIIRPATSDDAAKLVDIYSYYVVNTAVSFEYEIPSVEDFRGRISNTLKEYPCLVAEEDGEILGYVYASGFHSRMAYKHCAELSIYLNKDERGRGLGRILYNKIEEILLKQNIVSLHACIAIPDGEDEYVTSDSEHFHEKMGFKRVGIHERCGFKFNRWYSIIWMDKEIAPKTTNPNPFVPFSDLDIKMFEDSIYLC